jgi:glutaredoxin
MTIRIYTAKHCIPCKEVEEKIKPLGETEQFEVIDIETDEGFEKFKKEVLDHSDGSVPSAYKDGQRCIIGFNDDGELILDCPAHAGQRCLVAIDKGGELILDCPKEDLEAIKQNLDEDETG